MINNEDEILKMFDTNELNRLQRCAKDKNKEKIREWGEDFERRLNQKYSDIYRERLIKQFEERLKDIDVGIIYSLHFNENTRFGNKRLETFMNDLSATIRGFYKDDFNRSDYIQMLKDDGIRILGDWK